MLVSMKELLEAAERETYAVGGFNCPTLENVCAVVNAAEKTKMPVILSFPQVHEKTIPLTVIGPILLQAAKNASVPMCVHLDHGSTLDYIEKALEIGFNSVMYDGSKLSLEENIANTQKVVDIAKNHDACVEAELGGIFGEEAGISTGDDIQTKLTDPDEAVRFVQETGVDSLAASIGTAHGFYAEAPNIDFARIEEIHTRTGVPLVMHGGSGVSEEDYGISICKGIRKINYYSYMAKAGVEGVKALLVKRNVNYFHELHVTAIQSMEQDVEAAIRLFAQGAKL